MSFLLQDPVALGRCTPERRPGDDTMATELVGEKMPVNEQIQRVIVAIALSTLLGACASTPQDPVSSLTEGSTGNIAYKSRTLNDKPHMQLASGPPAGEEAIVEGRLRFPEGEGPDSGWPAVIYSHGSGGILPRHEDVWLSTFRELGYATFQIDHFGPRGISETVGDQAAVSPASMAVDVFRAQALLQTHPEIDGARIGVMGSSKGGMATLLTTKKSWQSQWNDPGPSLAFHIPLYPGCQQFETYDVEAPVFIMHAEEDGWVSVEHCAQVVEKMVSAGVEASIEIYEGAYHAFDSDKRNVKVSNAQSYTECRFMLRDDGSVVDLSTDQVVDTSMHVASKSCRTTASPYIGGNAEARAEAVADTKAFLHRIDSAM